jgi:hypothetical protein
MKYCDSCEVYIHPGYARCPLCHKDLGATEGDLPYPKVAKTSFEKKHLTKRMKGLVALTIFVMGICVLINLVLWAGVLWSLLVVAPALYAWLLVAGTLLSPWQKGVKVLMQVAGISAVLVAIEFISASHTWAHNYVIPFLIITGIIMEIYYTYENRRRWRENLVYVVAAIFIGFVPLALWLTGVITVWWPAVICAFMAVFTLIGMRLFAVKQLKHEMTKRFHV